MSDADLIDKLLKRGIALAKAGRKWEARQTLMRVIELDERNEQVWLWLSGIVDLPEERRICMENVLAINPHNLVAQKALRWLDEQQAAQSLLAPAAPVRICPHCGRTLLSDKECPECSQLLDGSSNQGWGETMRRVSGLWLPLVLAALANARLSPLELSLIAWMALLWAGAGAYLWASAVHVPKNPGMQIFFGEAGVKGAAQVLVGLPGIVLWLLAFGLILSQV